jgi:beta-galactosidase/beta-glucuronidase
MWINGKYVGDGDNFNRIYTFSIAPILKPGTKWITVAAVNGADSPNPAG